VGFSAYHSHAATSHKEKKMQNKNSTPYRMRPRHRREKRVSRCSKERKEKGGEGRRKKAETHSAKPTGLDLAGH
jgi:hypothetical protein